MKSLHFNQRRVLICAAVVLMLACGISSATTYYIDSVDGDDNNAGTATSAPWQTLTKVNSVTFQPGDQILLKAGSVWAGQLNPQGSGTEQAPIILGVYGDGDRPVIHAGGVNTAGLLLLNVSYWEVSGLEITNTDGTDDDQGDIFGIYVRADGDEGTYRHIYIDDCYIHDVNGKVEGKRRGGIHVHVIGLDETIFDDLRITNNHIYRVGGVGIGNSSSCGDVEFFDDYTVSHYLWTNVYVAGNYVDYTGRNCIIARVSKDAVYEHNILANSSRYSSGHSIFCFDCDGMKIQYNEAYGNVGDDNHDRGGFDADYNCINTYIQYNYSHDNEWFCGIMKRNNRNVVIRYNISQNEKRGLYFYGFDSETLARDIHIYNNVHFVSDAYDIEVFPVERTPLNTTFENNIFYFEGQGEWGPDAAGINTIYRNNVYYNITPHILATDYLVADPQFVNPGVAGTDIDLTTMDALKGYRLRPGSLCINAGIEVSGNSGMDFWGNVVPYDGATDCGVHEYQYTGPDTLFEDGFEDCFTNWDSNAFCSGQSYEGLKAAKMNNFDYAEAAIDTRNYATVLVSYARKTSGLDPNDSFVSEWYDGTAWNTIEDITSGFTGWTVVSQVALPSAAAGNPDFKIRFSVIAGSNYANVDNVKVEGAVCGGLADFDCDEIVDIDDLSYMVGVWLTDDSIADIAQPADGIVNLRDLAILAQEWLE